MGNPERGKVGYIICAGLWLLWETGKDLFFGWIGGQVKDSFSGGGMAGFLGLILEYGIPVTLLGFGVYFLFRNDKLEPNWTLREAFKYLMLDSKWSIGKKLNPFDNSGGLNGKFYSDMTNSIEKMAKAGKVKFWALGAEIEPVHWNDLSIDITTCMGNGESATLIERQGQRVRLLTDTMVNKRQFLSVWPKPNFFEKQNDKDLRNLRKMFYSKEYQHDDG